MKKNYLCAHEMLIDSDVLDQNVIFGSKIYAIGNESSLFKMCILSVVSMSDSLLIKFWLIQKLVRLEDKIIVINVVPNILKYCPLIYRALFKIFDRHTVKCQVYYNFLTC